MTSSAKASLSVVLATHNEAGNLPRCLQSVIDLMPEIVVVDGESTDDTAAIARKLGAKVIETTNKPMFHTNKQMAMDAATGDWILQLDADEAVDDTLRDEIRQLLTGGSPMAAYYLKRKNYFLGRFLTKGGQYPDPVIRLYKRGQANLPQKDVHEQMAVEGEVGTLNGHLLHYNAPTFHRYLTNANRYTSLTAQHLKQQGVAINWANDLKYLIAKPAATFLKLFVRHRGYVDGFPGLVFALFSGMHHALAYMKLADLYRADEKTRRS